MGYFDQITVTRGGILFAIEIGLEILLESDFAFNWIISIDAALTSWITIESGVLE